MGDFSKSSWAEQAFSDNYLERADIYVAERKRLLDILATLYRFCSLGRKGLTVCDLGCGDGIVTETLLKEDQTLSATLIDASAAMLKRARARLSGHGDITYIEAGFNDMIDGTLELPHSDFFVSSMAIHHLDMDGKTALFRHMFDRLNNDGYFINIDTVKPPTAELENLYFSVWIEWMQYMMEKEGVDDETPSDVVKRYADPLSTNRPDTIESQLYALRDVGFKNVDCFYKNGMFSIFLGQKR